MTTIAPIRQSAAAGAGSLVLFTALALWIKTGHAAPLDTTLVRALGSRVPLATELDYASMVAALVVAAAAVLVLARRRRFVAVGLWCATIAGMILLESVLKETIGRPSINTRSSDLSFPSGTAMLFAAVLAVAVASLPPGRRRRLAAGAAAALLVAQGITLVAAQWHYPSDVVAGWCVAVGWVSALLVALRVAETARARRAATANS